MSNVVEVERLTKSYGTVVALNEVSFSIEGGKIYGLLGRNGAGKTTIMQLLTAQVFATSGELKVFGEGPYENSRVLRQMCFIKESQKYPENFRLLDILDLSASFFPHWDRAYADSLSEELQLPLKRRMNALSRGMLSSVGIVVGLASRAPLTIFDEPYLGLDAVSRSIFYNRLIEDYAEYPRTIILSTHLIDEVSRLLEHVIVIDKGRLILNEDADILRGQACTVVGSEAQVEAFTQGKNLIHREQSGPLVLATLMERVNAEEWAQAEMRGLKFVAVSLQQLVIYLTSAKSGREEEKVR